MKLSARRKKSIDLEINVRNSGQTPEINLGMRSWIQPTIPISLTQGLRTAILEYKYLSNTLDSPRKRLAILGGLREIRVLRLKKFWFSGELNSRDFSCEGYCILGKSFKSTLNSQRFNSLLGKQFWFLKGFLFDLGRHFDSRGGILILGEAILILGEAILILGSTLSS